MDEVTQKDPIIIIIYDPENGNSIPDGKIKSSIETLYSTILKDRYLKTNFGNLSVLKEFILYAENKGINRSIIKTLKVSNGIEESLLI